MKRIITSISVLLIISISSKGQYCFTIKSLEEHIRNENELKSIDKGTTFFRPFYDERFDDMIGQFPSLNEQPRLFDRTNDNFEPKLTAWYFTDNSKKVKGIFYKWSLFNPSFNPTENMSLLKQQTKRLKEFIEKYNSVKDEIVSKIGQPTKHIELTNDSEMLYEYYVWDLKTHRTILELEFSKKLRDMAGPHGDFNIVITTIFKELE
jgi:hypothetical protein